jgi:glycosyltransferase involved in cell wall biosynthesis
MRCDLVLEQTLGHITHADNLRRLVPTIDGIDARFLPVEFAVEGPSARIPGWGNWTVRAGMRARRIVRRTWRAGGRPDAMFVHSQVPAVLLGRALTDVPTVVSLDATPKQYDELGEFYAHERGPEWLERAKLRLNQRCYERAAHIVTWSEWARRGLADDYGVDVDKVSVIAPGVDVDLWTTPRDEHDAGEQDDIVRILFVGGDLRRKGGDHLVTAFERLREQHGDAVELHLVTASPFEPGNGISVHHGLRPNTDELIGMFQRCDVFCLPTLGDCLPMVLPEAAAAGLATVSTDVGAIAEIVRHEETGLLVEVGSVDQIAAALDRLVTDVELRRRLAANAAELVRRDHDAARNAGRIVDVLRAIA